MARLLLGFRLLPLRLKRIGASLARICPYRISWWADFSFLLLDAILFFDLYEILTNTLARKTRSLTVYEETLLRTIFQDSLPYHLIRIDEYARVGPPQGNFLYVSFHTINSWGPIPTTILVHEAHHIWQYCRFGAAYIPRALSAQRTVAGYNYGGIQQLRRLPELAFYNYEQQADIIADAFALRDGYRTSWAKDAYPGDLSVFQPFLNQLVEVPLPDAYQT